MYHNIDPLSIELYAQLRNKKNLDKKSRVLLVTDLFWILGSCSDESYNTKIATIKLAKKC